MSLSEGSQLGPYEIESPLGKGGMGEVWAARDPRVDRRVAIKVLPEDFSRDDERLARFEREARALAALNHPNVATLFGFERHEGQPLLVMELATGESLSQLLGRGPLDWREALPLFEQIAEGLEAAHSRGLVHRDLKPSNIMVDDDGRAVILDFGLARAVVEEAGAEPVSIDDSPTLTAATAIGTILGTAAYMAPEQARGKRVDHRADIWAWGCCLWETLTGRRPFAGEDVAMTLAAVLSQEPDWSALPEEVPAPLRTLLSRCLDKNPRTRLQHIGEARWWLGQSGDDATTPKLPLAATGGSAASAMGSLSRQSVGQRPWLATAAAAVLLLLGTAAGFWLAPTPLGDAARLREPVRFQVEASAPRDWNSLFGHQVALSADGRTFAYPAGEGIYLHSFASGRADYIPGTERAWGPALSPDGQWLAFWRDNALHKVDLEGGLVQQLCLTPGTPVGPLGVVWHEGFLLFGSETGLWRVPQAGGEPENLLPNEDRAALFPGFLPSGRIVFTPATVQGVRNADPIEVLDPADGSTRPIGIEGLGPRYLGAGYLTWLVRGQLWAARFGDDQTSMIENAVPVLALDAAQPWALPSDVSVGGALVSGSGSGEQLIRISASGETTPIAVEPGILRHPRWSSDGSRLAFTRGGVGTAQIFIHEIATGRTDRLSSYDNDVFPVWTGEGRVVFFDPKNIALAIQPLDRSREPEVLFQSDRSPPIPTTISPEGVLLFTSSSQIWKLQIDRPGEAEPWLETAASTWGAAFSPDGRWVAYVSDDTGGTRVYVGSFDGSAGRQVVSTDTGWSPSWSSDGRTLFFVTPTGLAAVAVAESAGSLELGKSQILGGLRTGTPRPGTRMFERDYDPDPDGNGFVAVETTREGKYQVVLGLDAVIEEAMANADRN